MGKLFNDGTEAGNVLPPFNEADGFQDTNAGTAILNSYHDKYFDLYFRYPGLPKDRFRFSYRVRDQKESHSGRYFQTDTGGLQVAAHDDRHYPSMLDLTIGNGHLYLFCNPVLLTNIYAVDSNKIPFSTSCSATWNKAVHCWMSIARSSLTAGGRPGIQQPVAVHFVSAIAPFSLVHAAGRRILVVCCSVAEENSRSSHWQSPT